MVGRLWCDGLDNNKMKKNWNNQQTEENFHTNWSRAKQPTNKQTSRQTHTHTQERDRKQKNKQRQKREIRSSQHQQRHRAKQTATTNANCKLGSKTVMWWRYRPNKKVHCNHFCLPVVRVWSCRSSSFFQCGYECYYNTRPAMPISIPTHCKLSKPMRLQ